MVETEFHIAQAVLLLPLFITVFLIRWAFVNWIIQRTLTESFWSTVALALGSLIVGGLFLIFFEAVTYSPENFVLIFSMGIEGFANLFWLMIAIWFGSSILDYFILRGLYSTYLPYPLPNQMRIVLGILWSNFFSAPFLTLVVWLLQFE